MQSDCVLRRRRVELIGERMFVWEDCVGVCGMRSRMMQCVCATRSLTHPLTHPLTRPENTFTWPVKEYARSPNRLLYCDRNAAVLFWFIAQHFRLGTRW